MSSTTPPRCIITDNPDIAGIGVRLSIYIPALVITLHSSFVAVKVLMDIITGKLSEYAPPLDSENSRSNDGHSSEPLRSAINLADLEGVIEPQRQSSSPTSRTSNPAAVSDCNGVSYRQLHGYFRYLSAHPHYFQSTKSLEISLYTIGYAILITAEYNDHNTDLSPYHLLLVLNLSLIIIFACSSFHIFRLSSMLRKVEIKEDVQDEAGIMSTLTTLWYRMQQDNFLSMPHSLPWSQALLICFIGCLFWNRTIFLHSFSGWHMTADRLLSSYNASISMSSLGAGDPSQCVTYTVYWAFIALPIESTLSIQIVSLIFYIGTAIPYLIFPFLMISRYCKIHSARFHALIPTMILFQSLSLTLELLLSVIIYIFFIVVPQGFSIQHISFLLVRLYGLPDSTLPHVQPIQPLFPIYLFPSGTSTKLIYATLIIANLGPVVFLIVSTEQMISINCASRNGGTIVGASGSQWTYGQVLTLVCSLVDIVTSFEPLWAASCKASFRA
ncbi:hypothetical protein C8R42DRAFT_435649 [Lentinula raphanica]|nr:hypothetical protein C8R42DRAFT_435649 [Lentinula raphanica]